MITQQLVVNPGFEIQNSPDGSDPAAWMMAGYNLMSKVGAYSGQWCASLCGHNTDNATDALVQTISLPSNATITLTFMIQVINSISLPDTSTSCTFTLAVESQSVTTPISSWDINSPLVNGGWLQVGPFDLSAYSGKTIQLGFVSAQVTWNHSMTFLLDNVYMAAALNLPASSFPPLISNLSQDTIGDVQLYGNDVYCSCLIPAQGTDLFYNPTYASGLTGYAADGFYYTAGVQNPSHSMASWWGEATGGGDGLTRGATQEFPTNMLILVTDESISLLNQVDNMSMWMIFKKGANNAYSDTFGISGASFIPFEVSFGSGLLSVTFVPQGISAWSSPVVLNVDFVNDYIYIDTAGPPPSE